jgi:hypothetical protein
LFFTGGIVGGAENNLNFIVWRHLVWDKTTPEVVAWMSKMNMTADILTLGCFQPTDGTMYMSMYGSVTDGQVFSRTLEENQMEDITSCNCMHAPDFQLKLLVC